MHSARSTYMTKAVLHVRLLIATEALVEGLLAVGGAEVKLVR